MATCMLIDAGMEKRYWGEAVLTATYLPNRLPSRSLQLTPYELWWGRKPDLAHLRVFGSEAYVHVPGSKRSKLDSKSRKLRFVGYSMEHKAYRFVDCETDSIVISRDARFLELGNGTSTIEFPMSNPEAHRDEKEEENKQHPIEEEDEEDDAVSDEEEFEDTEDEEDLHRPQRSTRGVLPRRFKEYVLDYAVGYAACAIQEPVNYQEAQEKDDRRAAMEELESHRRNYAWKLLPLPEGKKQVGSNWVFELKHNEEGKVVKHKARPEAQGYTQRIGEDFNDNILTKSLGPTKRECFCGLLGLE